MPVVGSSSIKPTKIATCKRTYIVAKGVATATHKNAATAVKQAKDEAKSQRASALQDATNLVCPQDCGSGKICRDEGTTRTGFSLDWTVPVKDAATGLWKCRAWATYSVYRHCRCRTIG